MIVLIIIGAIEEYGSQLGQLINDKNFGVVTSALGLLQEMAIHNPDSIKGGSRNKPSVQTSTRTA